MKKSIILTIFLFSLMFSGSVSAFPLANFNEFLENSARSDLIGPEMWNYTITMQGNLPQNYWVPPRLGFHGLLYLGNQTEISDILTVEIYYIASNGSKKKVELEPTRNEWTPAGMTTYYRAKPYTEPNEYPKCGDLAVKETKCITGDNVFVSELTLEQDSSLKKTYIIEFKSSCKIQSQSNQKTIFDVNTALKAGGLRYSSHANYRFIGFGVLDQSDNSNNAIPLNPYERKSLRYSFCVDMHDPNTAFSKARVCNENKNVFNENVSAFNKWMSENIPQLDCDNLSMLKAYYYRWFVVFRNHHNPRRIIADHPYIRPAFYESPTGTWYSCVIGLPVPLQILESRWLRNDTPGWDHILNWADKVPGYQLYIQFTPMAIWQFYQNRGGKENLRYCYKTAREFTLSQFENGDLNEFPVQEGSWNTGAEYQPNFYQFTNPKWDWRNDSQFAGKNGFEKTKLIRLDKLGFSLANLKALNLMAVELGYKDDEKFFAAAFEKLQKKMFKELWDTRYNFLFAADAKTLKLTDEAPCYDSFVPFMFGMVKNAEKNIAFEKLFDRSWFWTDFGVTTASKTCPMYWSGNDIVGPVAASIAKPFNYPGSWNGPVWHYANSIVGEALGGAALSTVSYRGKWIELFDNWTQAHFLYGDRSVPAAKEHYRATDGKTFLATTDYFHSAWINQFMTYWAGIRVDNESQELIFEPYSEEVFTLKGVPIRGKVFTFEQQFENGEAVKSIYNASGDMLLRSKGSKPLNLKFSSPGK